MGRVVKTIGDEVFFVAPTVDAACRIGTDVVRAAHEDAVLPQARGAVGVGPVTPREGDYFGPLVSLLSRLVKVGQPGDLVLTAEAAAELPEDSWSVQALEPAIFRGVEGPVEAFRAVRRPALTTYESPPHRRTALKTPSTTDLPSVRHPTGITGPVAAPSRPVGPSAWTCGGRGLI